MHVGIMVQVKAARMSILLISELLGFSFDYAGASELSFTICIEFKWDLMS